MAIKPAVLGNFIEKRCELSFGPVAVGLTSSALTSSACQDLLGKFIQGSLHAVACSLQKDPSDSRRRVLTDRNSAMLALVVVSAPPVDLAALASPKVLYMYRSGLENEPLTSLNDVCCCEVLHASDSTNVGAASRGLSALLHTLATPITFEKLSESSRKYDSDVSAQATRLKLVLRLLEGDLGGLPEMPLLSAPTDSWSLWISTIEDEITETNEARATQPGAGLHLEVRHWVSRAIRFHDILHRIDVMFPDSTYFTLPTPLRSRLDSAVTRLREALYEAQDCGRYLLALEPWFDVLYSPAGLTCVRDATNAVPTVVDMLAQGIATSRFLSAPHNAAVLFQQLANRLAVICVDCIRKESSPSLWHMDTTAALDIVTACKNLHACLHSSFAAARSRLATVPTGPQLEFSPSRAFHSLNAVVIRLTNLGSMLQAFQHLDASSRLPIHGMAALKRHTQSLLDILKRRKYDILDVRDITVSDVKRELAPPDGYPREIGSTQLVSVTPASRLVAPTPLFPPLSLPSSAVSGRDVSLDWRTPAIGAIDTSYDVPSPMVAWSPAPTLQRPKTVAGGRPLSLRATIHLRSASALAKRSPSELTIPAVFFLQFPGHLMDGFADRSTSPTRKLASPSSVGSGSKSRTRSLSPSESHLVFHSDVLSPVGMSAVAAVEADAVLSAEVRFRNRQSRSSRQQSPTRQPDSRMSTGTMNKRFISSLALRRETTDEFFLKSDHHSSGDSGELLSFNSDFSAFQAVYVDLLHHVGSLLVRHVQGQASCLQATIGVGMAVATGVLTPQALHADVVTCLNEVANKLGAELKRVRLLSAEETAQNGTLSLWSTRLDRTRSLLQSMIGKLPSGTLHASLLPTQLENLSIACEELQQRLQMPVSTASLESVSQALRQPVLKASESELAAVSWQPLFDTVWEAAKLLVSKGQRLPLHVEDFCGRRESMFRLRASLQSLLNCLHALVAMLRKDPYFRPLLEPAVASFLNRVIDAGTRQLTWGSSHAVLSVETLVSEGHQMLATCNDMHAIVLSQVEAVLRSIRQLQFFRAPEGCEPVSLEDFVTSAVTHITKTEGHLTVLFTAIDKGFQLASFTALSLYPNDSQEFQNCRMASKEILKVVESRAVSALTVAICDSLRLLLKTFHHGSPFFQLFCFSFVVSRELPPCVDFPAKHPIIHVGLRLQIPNAVLHPSLETIQRALCGLARSIVAVARAVSPLVNSGPLLLSSARSPSSKQSIYPVVACSKSVTCLVLRIAGCTRLATNELDAVVMSFTEFDRLWQDNRDACIDEFVKSCPEIGAFVDHLQLHGDASQRLISMCAEIPVAWMVVDTSMLCRALSKEALKWQQGYGRALVDWVYRQVEALRDFFDTTEDELRRPVVQLKQLNECLLTLNAIDSVDAEVRLRMDPLLKAAEIFEAFTLVHEFDVQELAANLQDRWSKLQQLAVHIREDMLCREREFQALLATEKASLATAVGSFVLGWSQRGPGLPGLSLTVARQRLEKFQQDLVSLQQRIGVIAQVSGILGHKFSGFPALDGVATELERLESVLTLLHDVHSSIDRYKQRTWKELRFDAVSQDMAAYAAAARALPSECHALPSYKALSKLVEQFSAILPLLIALSHPTVTVRHWRALESGMNSGIPTSTGRLSTGMFLLSAVLATPILKHRSLVESITYAARKEAEVETKLAAVVRQWESAALVIAPSVTAANHGRKLLILHQQSTSELLSALEEAQLTLSVLSSSRYHHPYAHELEEWALRLTSVRDTLEPALAVQSTLLYLENVFSSVKAAASLESSHDIGTGEDLSAQLPEESQVFASVCKLWGRLMSRIEATPSVVHVCVVDTALGHSLSFLESQLDRCKRALTGYLARKRHRFPRFYFLSDTALLEVLALSTGMQSLKRHLSNMFDSVVDVMVHPNVRSRVIGLIGIGQHKLQFDPAYHVNTRVHVEDWLRALLEGSRASIRGFLGNGTQSVGTAATTGKSLLSVLADAQSREGTQAIIEALTVTPAQVLVWSHRLLWTLLCEGALQQWIGGDKSALHRLRLHYAREFRDLIDWMAVLRCDSQTPPAALSTLEAIVTLESHHCDVVSSLATIAAPAACDAFEWKRHLRCYPASTSDVVRDKGGDELHRFPWPSRGASDENHSRAEVLDVTLEYSYEYVSGHSVLVVTPLTNRCQIAMSSAMRHGLGTAALGPAGTGKTETVKDVGRALGRFVVVTGCSEDTGPEALSRLYLGTAKSGAWLDLDEFNRLRPDVLSVAAAQVACVLSALRHRAPSFVFTDGYTHALRFRESALFVTMNPDYAGRSALPDNLQACFRSVAMVVPDSLAILRVKFACMGFTTASRLASRLDQLFQAARNTIPQRKHYEFSLRLMLSVLKHLHGIKREAKAAGTFSTSRMTMRRRRSEAIVLPSEMEEAQLVRDAVCVMVLPNLVPEDRNPFLDLLDLCFQGVLGPSTSITSGELRPSDSMTALRSINAKSVEVDSMIEYATATAGDRGLVASATWIQKFTELANVTASRLGVIVLGPSHSGKTGLIKSLCDARGAVVSPVKECRVYPKALPLPYLYGELDGLTHEWTDGVLTKLWRKAVADAERRASAAAAPLPTLRSIARAVRWMSASSPKAFQVVGTDSRDRRSTSPSRPSPPRRLSTVSPGESPWFVLDGPVEPIWVESLNSVLDDTRTLTLGNGDRLLVDSSMRFLLETDSLEHASPATVSRCGIVCVGPSVASWKNVLESFCCSQPLPLGRYLLVYFSAVFRPIMSLFARVCRASEPTKPQSAADVMGRHPGHSSKASTLSEDASVMLPVSQWVKQMLCTALALGKQLLPHTTTLPGVYDRPASPTGTFLGPNSPTSVKSPVMSIPSQPLGSQDPLTGMMSADDAAVWGRICSCAVVTTLGSFLSPVACVWLHDAIQNHDDFVVPDAASATSNFDFVWRGSDDQRGLYHGASGYSAVFPSGASIAFDFPDSFDGGSMNNTIFNSFLNEAGEWEKFCGRHSSVSSSTTTSLGMGVPKALSTALPLLRSPNNLWSVAFEPGLEAVVPVTGRSSSHMFVNTPHSCRMFYHLALASGNGENVMVSGPFASGKSSVILRFGQRLSQASLAGNDPALTPVIAKIVSSKGLMTNVGIPSPKASSPRHSVADDRSVIGSPVAAAHRQRRGSITSLHSQESLPQQRGRSSSKVSVARSVSRDRRDSGSSGVIPRRNRSVGSAVSRRRSSRPKPQQATPQQQQLNESFVSVASTLPSLEPKSPTRVQRSSRTSSVGSDLGDYDDSRSVGYNRSSVRTPGATGDAPAPEYRRVVLFRETQLSSTTTVAQLQRRLERMFEKYVGGSFGVPTSAGVATAPQKPQGRPTVMGQPGGSKLLFGTSSRSFGGIPDDDTGASDSVDSGVDDITALLSRSEKIEKSLMIFIDDLSLPSCDAWGDWHTAEAMREVLEQRGFHTADKQSKWQAMQGFQVLATMRHWTLGPCSDAATKGLTTAPTNEPLEELFTAVRAKFANAWDERKVDARGLPLRLLSRFHVVHCSDPTPNDVRLWLFQQYSSSFRNPSFAAMCALFTVSLWARFRSVVQVTSSQQIWPHASLHNIHNTSRAVISTCASLNDASPAGLIRLVSHEFEREVVDCFGVATGAVIHTYPNLDAGVDAHTTSDFISAPLPSSQCWLLQLAFRQSVASALQDMVKLGSVSETESKEAETPVDTTVALPATENLSNDVVGSTFAASWPSLQRPVTTCSTEVHEQVRAAFDVAAAEREWLKSPKDPFDGVESLSSRAEQKLPMFVNFATHPDSAADVESGKLQPFDGLGVLHASCALLKRFPDRKYQALSTIAAAQGRLEEVWEWYADRSNTSITSPTAVQSAKSSSGGVNIVMFEQVVTLVCRIARVLALGGRHALLIGQSGIGKRTVATLAAYVASTSVLTLEAPPESVSKRASTTVSIDARGEPTSSLLDDLRAVVKQCGLQGRHVTVIVPETVLSNDAFSQFCAEYVSSHNVSRLFSREELLSMATDAGLEDALSPQSSKGRAEARIKQKNLSVVIPATESSDGSPAHGPTTADGALSDETVVVLADALNARVSSRLRFVFCVSPEIGSHFGGLSGWLARHPNIASQCTVNWYMPWSVAAKTSVAQGVLHDSKLMDGSFPSSAQGSPQIPRVIAGMHDTTCAVVRAHGLTTAPTPQVFLTSLKWFDVQSSHAVSSIQGKVWALTTGLEKLSSARRDIQLLTEQAATVEAELVTRSASLETLLADINDKKAIAAVEAAKIEDERAIVAAEAGELTVALEQVEVELAAAQPAVQAALDSLKKVNPSDVATLRTLQQPPGLIKRIMDGVLILLQRSVGRTKLPPAAAPVFGQPTSASLIGQSLDENFLLPSWDLAFKLLASMSAPAFLKLLADFDLSTVNDETVELLAPYLEMPDFEERSARRVCGSMSGLCTWVRGMVAYHELIKTVKPKADAVTIAQQRVKLKNQQLAAAEAALQQSLDRLRLLAENLLAAQASKAELEDTLDGIRSKITKANDLLDNMAAEQFHWIEQKERLERDLGTCIPTALFAVAACLYAGPQPVSLRTVLFQKWGEVLVDHGVASRALVGSFVEASGYLHQLVDFSLSSLWLSDGMSADEHSSLSALCVELSTQMPSNDGTQKEPTLLPPALRPRAVLMIDPDNIGRRWIMKRRRDHGLVVLSAATGHATGLSVASGGSSSGVVAIPEILRQCMTQGKPLLVTDVGPLIHSGIRQIAAWLHGGGAQDESVAAEMLYHSSESVGGSLGSCVFAGVDVSVKLGFELYLSVTDTTGCMDAQMLSNCTTVHFGACLPSLTSILLDAVVDTLHPDVNSRQQSLLATSHSLASQVTDLNARLLHRLTEGHGSLLDDPMLITVLRDMKRVHGDVEQRQHETKSAVAIVDTVRNTYLPVAQTGAACYFANLDMQQLSPYYRMTLPRLLDRFLVGIRSCGGFDGVANATRLNLLRNAVVTAIATSMLRGIGADHEVSYRFYLAARLAGRVSTEELATFRSLLVHRQHTRGAQLQMATYRARTIQILSRLPALNELAAKLATVSAPGSTRGDKISEALRGWREWLSCEAPETAGLPGSYTQALTPFQHLLVVCAVHPHRFVPALEAFVKDSLPPVSRSTLESVLGESDAATPVLVLHTDGQEAETWLQGLADANGFPLKLASVGTGQRGRIEALLKKSFQEGCWLALAGCHLAAMESADDDTAAILHAVEAFVRGLGSGSTTVAQPSSFRLWLLTDLVSVLPQPLVQLCVPVVVESGTLSVSATIQRSLKRLPASVLDDIEDIDNGLWRKLVFMLSVVHAAVSGRAKYQRVGWSKRYKFSTADFLAAVDVFSAYVRDQQQEMSEVSIPWRQLQFVVLESVYGGRAADRHDLRVLRAYGDMWVHDVVTQLGYTFSYCRAVSNEGSVTPALGWLAWRDVEPPIPPRDPFSSQLSTKLLRLGSSTNISSTLRTSSGSSSMMHTHRRISVAKALPSPPDLDVESDKACLRAPTDSQAKRLSDFWRYVDSLDGDDHPEWLGIHPAFEIERKQASSVLVESCLMQLLDQTAGSELVSRHAVPSSTTALIQNLLQSIPAVKRLQVPTDVGWLRPVQAWLDAEISQLRRVLEVVHADALECLACIRAVLPLPPRLMAVIEEMSGDTIPPSWRAMIPEPASLTTLSTWLGQMTRNWQQLRNLAGTELRTWAMRPLQLSLAGMAHPVSLFEALRCISTSSSAGCSLDGVKLVAEVLSTQDIASLTLDPAPFAKGVILTGVQIVGAVWDTVGGCLVDLPEGANGTITTLAPLFIRAVPSTDVDVDHERSGSAALGGDVLTNVSGAADSPVGRVGPGSVTGLMAGDPDDADAPLSYFGPGNSRVHRVFSHTKLFACPLYQSPRRLAEDHVFDVWIPVSLPAQHWILRGVHLLL